MTQDRAAAAFGKVLGGLRRDHEDHVALEGFGLSAEDSAVLRAIMSVGSQGRLEFLT